MKKRIALLIAIFVCIVFLGACDRTYKKADKLQPTQIESVNGFEGIAMTIKKGTVSSTGLAVILENYSDREFVYAPIINLEVKIDDMWYQVPVLNYIDYNMALSCLEPGDDKELDFNWEYEYGKLGKGKYRVILYEQILAESEESEWLTLAAEFEIE